MLTEEVLLSPVEEASVSFEFDVSVEEVRSSDNDEAREEEELKNEQALRLSNNALQNGINTCFFIRYLSRVYKRIRRF